MGVGGDAPFLVYCGFLLPVVPPCFLAHSHSLPDAQEWGKGGGGKKGQYSGLSKSVVQCLLYTPPPHSFSLTLHYTLQRRSDLCIPKNETARPRSFMSGNICFEFSVQCLCSAGALT